MKKHLYIVREGEGGKLRELAKFTRKIVGALLMVTATILLQYGCGANPIHLTDSKARVSALAPAPAEYILAPGAGVDRMFLGSFVADPKTYNPNPEVFKDLKVLVSEVPGGYAVLINGKPVRAVVKSNNRIEFELGKNIIYAHGGFQLIRGYLTIERGWYFIYLISDADVRDWYMYWIALIPAEQVTVKEP